MIENSPRKEALKGAILKFRNAQQATEVISNNNHDHLDPDLTNNEQSESMPPPISIGGVPMDAINAYRNSL